MSKKIKNAWLDIKKSWNLRAIWLFLAWEDCSRQYRRTFLGPIWITLNTGIFIFSFAFIWSKLFGNELSDYLPYVATGHIFYTLISSIVIEGCSVFISNEAYLKQVPVPKFGFVIRLVLRNIILFSHNLLILFFVFLWYDKQIDWVVIYSVLAFIIFIINAIFLACILGVLCTRYRDIPMVIGNIMQILFFVTPVLWKVDQLPHDSARLINLNPIAVFLQLLRDPILGKIPDNQLWLYLFIFSILNFLVFILVFSKFRSKIVYWL